MNGTAPTDRHILASKQKRQDKYNDIETNNTPKRTPKSKNEEEERNSNEST